LTSVPSHLKNFGELVGAGKFVNQHTLVAEE